MLKTSACAIVLLWASISSIVRAEPTEADLLAHIEILASDTFQGRAPGTIGEAVASHYIAAQFAQAGLVPGNGASFYQRVPLVRRRAVSAIARWNASDLTDDEILLIGRDTRNVIDAPVLFAGYGADIGEEGSGLTRAEIQGAAVFMLSGTPDGDETMPRYAARRSALAELGPAAL